MRVLKRDPFARAELWRQPSDMKVSCAWCGNRPGRFTYAWVGDTQHSSYAFWSRPMCSVQCYRDFTDDHR